MDASGKSLDDWQPGPFISYSRRDLGFARKLYDALRQRRRDAWVDLDGIEPSEEWLHKLNTAIDASQAFVFVISEDSIRSPYCEGEVRRAVENNKKLIPILFRKVDPATLPPDIAKLQWISFLDESQFDARCEDLIRALDVDLEWNNEQTRLLLRAKEWERERRDKSYLLRGKDLGDAEAWLLASGQNKERQPTALQAEYIGASAQLQKRSRNLLLAAVSAAALIATVLAAAAFYQRNQAQENARQALSRLLASHATNDVERNLNLATLLSAAGYQQAPTFEARQALLRVANARPHLAKYLYGQTERIHRLAFDPSGALLVATGTDGAVVVWNVDSGQAIFRAEHGAKALPAVAISSQVKLLVIGLADGSMQALELFSWQPVAPFVPQEKAALEALSFTADGRWLAWGNASGTVSVYSSLDRSPVCVAAQRHGAPVVALRFGNDDRTLASLDSAGTALFWNVEQCRVVHEVKGGGGGRFGAISRDLSKSALSQEGFPEVVLTDLTHRQMERLPISQSDFIMSLDFHPAEAQLALGTRDGTVHLWHPAGNKISQSLRGHRAEVTGVAFNATGQRLASGTLRGEVILWDLVARYPMEPARSLMLPGLVSLAFLADGERILGVAGDGKVALWHRGGARDSTVPAALPVPVRKTAWSADGTRLAALTNRSMIIRTLKDSAVVDEIALERSSEGTPLFSPDGRYVAYGDGGKIFLWSLERRTKTQAGPAADSEPALAFSSEGRTLAFASAAKQVTFFDTETSKAWQRAVPGHISIRSLALSGDGKILATGGGMYDGNIVLWDNVSGRLLRTLQPNDPTDVTRLFFSPDNQTLASVTAYSNQLRLWHVASGRLLRAPIRVGDAIDALPAAFSLDGSLLATVEKDAVVLRDLNPATWIRAACRVVNRNMTKAEWQDYVGSGAYQPQCLELPAPN